MIILNFINGLIPFNEYVEYMGKIVQDKDTIKTIKKDLKLSDRDFICHECGVIEDRDKNASYNSRDAKLYKTA